MSLASLVGRKKDNVEEAKRRRKKISFFGNFGQGNLGNESTLQAILHHLRRHLPDAEVTCICTGPEATARIHNISVVPICGIIVKPGWLPSNPLLRLLRKVLIGIPSELYRWLQAVMTFKGIDMLIVPGTQFLSDNLTGPFGWPYLAFKWSVASKVRGCKLLFVSVGVGPLRHWLSRFFIKSALMFADYRSYRDEPSREYMRSIGFDSTNDPVYPDLAFSLPKLTTPRGSHSGSGKSLVAVGVKDYRGQYGSRPRQQRPEVIYRNYLGKVSALVAWLLDHMYTVRLVIGDASYDTRVLADLKESLKERQPQYDRLKLIDEPAESVEQLVSQLATSDIVVSPRFHNVVFSLLVTRPIISLSYHEKFSTLMEATELARYNLDIDDFDQESVITRIIELEENGAELKLKIGRRVEEYRSALDEQYNLIFRHL